MSKKRELAELDREFNAPGSTMPPSVFAARREEITARASTQDEAAEQDEQVITFGTLKKMGRNIAEGILSQTRPIRARVAGLEEAIPLVAAETVGPVFKRLVAVEDALDPLGSRVSAVEFKCGALALNLARDPAQRADLANVESLLQRIADLEARLETLERE